MERLNEIINSRVLPKKYDMLMCIEGDNYRLAVRGAANGKPGSIAPRENEGSYSGYINERVLALASPVVHDKSALAFALSLETAAHELETKEPYIVDLTCDINGETYFKRFSFFEIDKKTHSFLLMAADFTDIIEAGRGRSAALVSALKTAEQANSEKAAFLSNISYEMRTPLNAIIGMDTLALQDENLSEQTRQYLEKIGGSARHLLGIFNDILGKNLNESGRLVRVNEELNDVLSEESPRRDLNGIRVLLAEDIEINAEIIRELLLVKYVDMEHAENGKKALRMFAESPAGYYDAVLMDIRMPEMDGLETAMAIRALDRPDAASVPIIALTANAFDDDAKLSFDAGMNAHLTKPVEPELLYRTLETLIK